MVSLWPNTLLIYICGYIEATGNKCPGQLVKKMVGI